MADLLSRVKGGKCLEIRRFRVHGRPDQAFRPTKIGTVRLSARALLAALAALALWAPAAGGAGRAHGCVPAGARVLARDAAVRVYETVPKSGPLIAACLVGHTGHMTLLAPEPHVPLHRSLGRFALAGRIVAFLETQFGVDSGTSTLVVVDVGARRVLRAVAAGWYADAGILDRRSVTRFVLTPRGSIAWISEQTRHEQLVEAAVYAAGREGSVRLLESGADIDPNVLRLSGATLSWSRAGSPRTATMP